MPLKDPIARRKQHNAYWKKRYKEDPEFARQHRLRVRKTDERKRQAGKELVAQFQSKGCTLCDEKEPCCLSAHHIDGSTKEFDISKGIRQKLSTNRIKTELAKCVCLCENCHRKVHAGIFHLPIHPGGVEPPFAAYKATALTIELRVEKETESRLTLSPLQYTGTI